jgi:hypothetical protein
VQLNATHEGSDFFLSTLHTRPFALATFLQFQQE